MFAGGARAGYGENATARNAALTLWESFARMKYDAATLSSEDLQDMDSIPASVRPILTTANLYRADGTRYAPPAVFREVKLEDGRKVRVGIIGLVGRSPFDQPAATQTQTSAWQVKDATEALRAVLPDVRSRSDLVVVLYAGMRPAARILAHEVPGVDVMVAGLEGSVDKKPEMVGATALVQNADRGRFAAELGIALDDKRNPRAFDLATVPMSAEVPDDPAMTPLVREYQRRQAAPPSVEPAAGTGGPSPAGGVPLIQPAKNTGVYAGSPACAACHTAESARWAASKHAGAMRSLELKDGGIAAQRPDCVKCHVVGFGEPGGYRLADARADLRGVGCESCHGPGAEHAASRLLGRLESRPMARPNKITCVKCHAPDNSPGFDYARYLPRVMHTLAQGFPTATDRPSERAKLDHARVRARLTSILSHHYPAS